MNKFLLDHDILIKYPTTHPYKKPCLDKIILDASLSSKTTENYNNQILPLIYSLVYFTGQYPVIKKSKTSVASFKLRKGMEIGGLVTLGRRSLPNFLNILSYICLPHIAATSLGRESIIQSPKNPKLNRWIHHKTPNFSLGVKEFTSLISPLNYPLHSNFTPYKGGLNIQFIFKKSSQINMNAFILSTYHIPFSKETY